MALSRRPCPGAGQYAGAPAAVVIRVLVVDDDPQILRALRINLTARDYEVSRRRPGPRP